ncbi:hypothetical protein SAMN05216565_104178 [Litchfieldia salsa]|uniref:Uncharacterized protein n=1 Tax=Litchfieldia salsa TaxID=930152 RepID=A0A1H0U5W0_9BACI|nr:hypothetical protein SAMN05216565_104178 [Litchfieldia salsa]
MNGNKKSGSACSATGRHKAKHVGNLVFRSDSTYDPEGLGAEARHQEKRKRLAQPRKLLEDPFFLSYNF